MAGKSSIEWTEATWNPVTGCSKISPGCKHCYANRLALRLQAIGQPNYRNGFEVTLHPHTLEIPLGWKKEPDDFRELDERPFSPRSPAFFHPKSVLNDDDGTVASVSGSHKGTRTREEPRSGTYVDRKYLDGDEC